MTRRRVIIVTACVSAAAVLVTGGILLASSHSSDTDSDAGSHSVSTGTATVEKGDLVGTTTKQGTLERVAGTAIPGGPAGTLTSIVPVGTVITPGEVIYRVDNEPVTYLAGSLPQWRPFTDGMDDGPDVEQLESNLHAWGYLDEVPTKHFDWATTVAIKRWQKATGQPVTGTIELGRVFFGQGSQVVSERLVDVGSPVETGAELLATTETRKVVVVDLPVGSPLAVLGGLARVDLPSHPQVPGKVTSIGDPVTPEDGGDTTVAVSITLDDAKAAEKFDQVGVSVDFVSETRKDVVSVPVTALAAKAGTGFVVDVVGADGTTTSVTVQVGLFAGDRVEITAGGLRAGQKIVVPA